MQQRRKGLYSLLVESVMKMVKIDMIGAFLACVPTRFVVVRGEKNDDKLQGVQCMIG